QEFALDFDAHGQLLTPASGAYKAAFMAQDDEREWPAPPPCPSPARGEGTLWLAPRAKSSSTPREVARWRDAGAPCSSPPPVPSPLPPPLAGEGWGGGGSS